MSQQTVTKCDVCGKVKGDMNRWVRYETGTSDQNTPTLYIGSGPLDCCSDACMKDLVARVMTGKRDVDHATTATITERPAFKETYTPGNP